MVREAKKRLLHYDGNYPIWVWEESDYPNRNGKAWGSENLKMVILTLDVPKEWVLWSYFDYWCCAMADGSFYKNQTDQPTIEKWFTYMDKEYGIIFDFDYLLSHPDWCLGKEDSLKKQGLLKNSTFTCEKVQRFRAKEGKILSGAEAITGKTEERIELKHESEIKKEK